MFPPRERRLWHPACYGVGVRSSGWIHWAEAALDLFGPVRCPICGRRMDRARCRRCRLPSRSFALRELRRDRFGPYLVLAGGPFAGDWRRLVHAFKYHEDPGARRLLVSQTALAPPEGLRWDALAFVPAHRTRVRERGREPVREFSRDLARMLGLPWISALERVRYTEPLTGRRRSERQRIVAHAFHARPSAGCLLLVDDVRTTGATLAACRRALLESGAESVDLLVGARTSRPLPVWMRGRDAAGARGRPRH